MRKQLIYVAEGCVAAGLTVHEVERALRWAMIDVALAACQGNQTLAAERLGVHRNTLVRDLAEMRRAGRKVKANHHRGSAAPLIRRDYAAGARKQPVSAADVKGTLVEDASLLRSTWPSAERLA